MARRTWCVAAALAAAAGACATPEPEPEIPGPQNYRMYDLGESFSTDAGPVHLLRVQDEYRLVRCITEGEIAGCYEDIFSIPRDQLSDESSPGPRWNHWIDVPAVPGLRIALVDTGRVAVRQEPAPAAPR
jgi:hypothetical protein